MNFFFFAFFPVKYHQGSVDVQFCYNTVTATLIPDMDAMALFLPSQIQQQQFSRKSRDITKLRTM